MDKEKLSNVLEELGFTHGEAVIYLSLLRIGESKVGPIIKDSRISRSKVYDILERLIQKGVASKISKNNILFYQTLSPKMLFNYIKEKENKLKEEENILKKIIPELVLFLPKRDIDIKIYHGIEGFKSMIERTVNELKKSDTYYAFGISKTNEQMTRYANKIYLTQKSKKFKAKSIFDELGAYKIKERQNKLHEIKILPKGQITPALFTIYQDVVGIHLIVEDNIVSIVIKNKDISKSFIANFEAMWKISHRA